MHYILILIYFKAFKLWVDSIYSFSNTIRQVVIRIICSLTPSIALYFVVYYGRINSLIYVISAGAVSSIGLVYLLVLYFDYKKRNIVIPVFDESQGKSFNPLFAKCENALKLISKVKPIPKVNEASVLSLKDNEEKEKEKEKLPQSTTLRPIQEEESKEIDTISADAGAGAASDNEEANIRTLNTRIVKVKPSPNKVFLAPLDIHEKVNKKGSDTEPFESDNFDPNLDTSRKKKRKKKKEKKSKHGKDRRNSRDSADESARSSQYDEAEESARRPRRSRRSSRSARRREQEEQEQEGETEAPKPFSTSQQRRVESVENNDLSARFGHLAVSNRQVYIFLFLKIIFI